MIDFLCQIEILQLNIIKLFEIPGLFKISQIPGFLMNFLVSLIDKKHTLNKGI